MSRFCTKIVLALPWAVMLVSAGSSPAVRSLEALRRDIPFGVPRDTGREWLERLETVFRQFNERRLDAMAETLALPLKWAAAYHPNKLSLRTLTYSAALQMSRLDYPAALATLFETARQCEQIQDAECTAAVEANLSSLYFKIRAMPEALDAAEGALAARTSLRNRENRLRVLIHKARLLARQGRETESAELFRDVVAESERAGSTRVVAEVWEARGLERLFRGDTVGAGRCLRNAFRLRWLHRDPALPMAYRNLGLLSLRQRDLAGALELASKKGVSTLAPDWTVAQLRARAFEEMGDHEGAITEFRNALDLIAKFRLDGIPPTLRSSAADRNREIYDELIGSAWNLHRKTGQPQWIEFMLAASAAGQAVSLRHGRPAAVAPGYWPALADLQNSYAGMMETDQGSPRTLAHLRRRLIELQSAGAYHGPVRSWRPDTRAVRGWQKQLGDSSLLVFHVTDSGSYLWPVTSGSIGVCRIPGREWLAEKTAGFLQEVQSGRIDGPHAGAISRMIFDCVPASTLRARRWQIVPDGPLFDLPFAALPDLSAPFRIPLIEAHSISIVPGIWLLSEPGGKPWRGSLLGIADPVYNAADPRAQRAFGAGPVRPELPRLAASSREITRAAQALGVSAELLTGTGVTAGRIAEAFLTEPSIIHFATHVLPSPIEPREGLIALSAPARGPLEFLSTEWIAAQDLRPELVVLNACRSGSGTIRPGDGLMGLTRACMQAGARNIIATYWPTPDVPGAIIESFYEHWRAEPEAGLDEALRQAQLEAIRRGGWSAEPAFWAGFFLIGRPSVTDSPRPPSNTGTISLQKNH